MICFVDTSAILAILSSSDTHHKSSARAWEKLLNQEVQLITSNYVVLETSALLQHRLGLAALRDFSENILPVLSVQWVDESVHRSATASVLIAGRKKLSLVDCVSFELMRRLGVQEALTLDKHFREQGFRCLP